MVISTRLLALAIAITSTLAPTVKAQDAAGECAAPMWRLLFQNGADGSEVGGSRDDLLNAVRRGSPLRVAWGQKLEDGTSVVEFSDVGFTSLINGRDLSVHLRPALIQTDYLDADVAALRQPALDWRALMSTTGRFDALMFDMNTGETYRRLSQRAQMSWYALAPKPECDNRPLPELALPDGIILDENPPASSRRRE
jgi:hypothetical protein